MTPEQIAANRAEAVALIRGTLGLPSHPSEWTLEQREGYLNALADYIRTHPELFSADDVARANGEATDGTITLVDDSFSWGEFASEVGNNVVSAGEDVAGVGRGVLSSLAAMKYVIPVVVVGGALFVAWRWSNAVPLPKGKAKP